MAGFVVTILGLGYVAYRLSFSLRALRADRAGQTERADALRAKGTRLFLGLTSALTLLLVVWVFLLVVL